MCLLLEMKAVVARRIASRADLRQVKSVVDLKWQIPVTKEVAVDDETRAAIDRGIKDADEGRTVSLDDALKLIPQWPDARESASWFTHQY
jgi:predicted transcriptional regulator